MLPTVRSAASNRRAKGIARPAHLGIQRIHRSSKARDLRLPVNGHRPSRRATGDAEHTAGESQNRSGCEAGPGGNSGEPIQLTAPFSIQRAHHWARAATRAFRDRRCREPIPSLELVDLLAELSGRPRDQEASGGQGDHAGGGEQSRDEGHRQPTLRAQRHTNITDLQQAADDIRQHGVTTRVSPSVRSAPATEALSLITHKPVSLVQDRRPRWREGWRSCFCVGLELR
jgi:hypothetical protein